MTDITNTLISKHSINNIAINGGVALPKEFKAVTINNKIITILDAFISISGNQFILVNCLYPDPEKDNDIYTIYSFYIREKRNKNNEEFGLLIENLISKGSDLLKFVIKNDFREVVSDKDIKIFNINAFDLILKKVYKIF